MASTKYIRTVTKFNKLSLTFLKSGNKKYNSSIFTMPCQSIHHKSFNHQNQHIKDDDLLSLHYMSKYHASDYNYPQPVEEKRPLLNRILRKIAVGPLIKNVLQRSGIIVDPNLLSLISSASALGVYSLVFISSMNYFGVDTTPFIAGFSVAGAAIGFGLKDIAYNYVSGILLAVEGQFRNGDEVTVGGPLPAVFHGKVTRMTLRHLDIAIKDEKSGKIQHILVPNTKVFENPIIIHRKMFNQPSLSISKANDNQESKIDKNISDVPTENTDEKLKPNQNIESPTENK